MSKIKEAIDQQTEWYGIDTFAGLEELDQPTNTSHQARPTTRKVENPLRQQLPPPSRSEFSQHATFIFPGIRKLPVGTDHYHQPQRTTYSSQETFDQVCRCWWWCKTKSNKKKKIHYESKATRTIERVKEQAKHDSKSSPKKKSSSSSHRK
ncbi:hypothetical protein PSHT_05690 [Puccinia striiformis]|uniref:Uncharacterized protein n=1 Tax=Puccinia striiformis TaxID=27350 RepID=A0A2S4W9V4_9BASI|nr:hypothetical protein PSHT_05690 [Puccinia striiformis]